MFDLKVINSVLSELEDERGIPRAKVVEAMEMALATAYKKEYAKKGQVIRAHVDLNSGKTEFSQIKTVADETTVRFADEEEGEESPKEPELDADGNPIAPLPRFSEEQHITLADAKLIKRDASVGDELIFPLEARDDYGRIAAQTAKQVIIQKIREAEKTAVVAEFGKRQGEIISGSVQRMERGNLYVDLGRATGILPYEEQIPGERYRQGERIRALLYQVEESPRGIYLRLSRAHPDFLKKLFEMEAPEAAHGTVIFKAIAREAGSRSKVAVASADAHVDPVGSLVGQRGVRVSTVTSELGGEKIDIVEWSEDPKAFIEEALSPARVLSVNIDDGEHKATVKVAEDQQSLAIGRGGQNVRLAAKLTGWRIDIESIGGEKVAEADESGEPKETGTEVAETKETK
ncbi:transcription termination factor NusA [Candidatus Adlerbacteria bacterium RIFCSPHIGHO2_01_FULL_54_23]|uniref:Transcription termination/antitermination protein NusA n=3 Tax=Candidatus Adleribacteriota TaxID=1752736 RepID=A0A1F4Y247_9BACT|nr:MAG: NusA antitermination factor [Candidatus Adlerbacteria bacterium GW2011_GWA1_54_10]KKW36222.1 MAG: NusA antitermination factor [Candidatus Adlerbacteria bacterium GW2011_GWA2_54_12]KKW37583.1 MAG: NusA antitermination factor [Candidatus Adlerbacteria bacterium GW2011_GWB1_54_7]OGC79425.1 MAG: transcription termination factor NusA [Candidatus Adlerbacteria bacterium RIFCSPHIGHO2_01_FULL_54_23]OGC87403.1 MAG: transcription termination factor NusA [Candidatus Adlerbacteria bacterium RIFCSPL